MDVSKDQALNLASDYLRLVVKQELDNYFQQGRVSDALPEGAIAYWCLPGCKADYWFVEVPQIRRGQPLQVGGNSEYLAICKITGTVSIISTLGD